jgi:hypothetical protein
LATTKLAAEEEPFMNQNRVVMAMPAIALAAVLIQSLSDSYVQEIVEDTTVRTQHRGVQWQAD